MLVQAAWRALTRALRNLGRRLAARRGGSLVQAGEPEPPPDRYVWDRYRSDLCGACWGKEHQQAGIWLYADGRIEGRKEDIPPLHSGCDCALRNLRTGTFAFGMAGDPR